MEPTIKTDKYELYLGDCRQILPHLSGIEAVVSDPPYGMNWDTNHKRFTVGPNGHGGQTTRTYEKVLGDDKPFDPSVFLGFPRVVLFGFNHFAASLPVGTTLVWLKKFDSAFGSFLSDAEMAWMKGGHGVYCFRDTSLLGETKKRAHPTQKPVPLMQWCLEKCKAPSSGLVLDPFMGSGSTGVACLQTGRRFIGIEKEERYFNLAAARLEAAAAQGDLFEAQVAQQPSNKSLHPTAYSPLVPRYLPAAGELSRCIACARLREKYVHTNLE